MDNFRIKDLCLSLMKADTEEDVIRLLSENGFWENPAAWRFYGDIEKNFSEIGNQASRFDVALVEKLVNSVDARLMNECLARGIDPEASSAPQFIREAVSLFFEDSDPKSTSSGRIKNWSNAKRTETAKGITLAATGASAREGNACFTISDCGEGQTPEMMPKTLLSLPAVAGSNKIRIPFVQGKFNMGGSGVLRFCGYHNLQLILTRRNPTILRGKLEYPSDSDWGFTVVRRENPDGNRRSSVYTYLAPMASDQRPNRGGILHFHSERMPIFPEAREAYARNAEWGTLIKLYEYHTPGHKTHILRKDGLLERLDLLLPDIALPVRLYECRASYRGHEGSFETTLNGLSVRLSDDRGENLELGFPSSSSISALGNQMTATIYAFKRGRAETYRRNEGVIFIVNGQTHGHMTIDFFRRKSVGLSYLGESLFVVVDCSQLAVREREDLFMNSRDRLSATGELRSEIERSLEDLLRHHDGLRSLKEQRRQEELQSHLEDSKPLEDILRSLIERYPALSALFLPGQSASNPFKTIKVREEEKPYQGKPYPTYFRFKGREYGEQILRECHINMRCRVAFETDATNDYFSRDENPGRFELFLVKDSERTRVENYAINPHNGIATLSLRLPEDSREADELFFAAEVTDVSRVDPFLNQFHIRVKPVLEPGQGTGERKSPPGTRTGQDLSQPAGIQIPRPQEVYEADWAKKEPPFDQYTALRIKDAGLTEKGQPDNDAPDVYDFFVNMDNVHLKRYLKTEAHDSEEEKVARIRFKLGMVLVGLALIHHAASEKRTGKETQTEEPEEVNIEDQVESVTKAIAPFLLPLIESLGSIDDESSLLSTTAGEAT